MLILTRRPNESVHVGDEIVVTVLSVKGAQVRIGIAAPKHVVVDREEVHQRKLAGYAPPAQNPSLATRDAP